MNACEAPPPNSSESSSEPPFFPFPPIALFLMELTIDTQFRPLRVNKWRKKSPLDEKFLFQFHNVESRCF